MMFPEGTRSVDGQIKAFKHGAFTMASWPVRVDGKPPRLTPSPLLGQHNDEVLHDWLGIDAAERAALKREGVL